MNSSLSDQQLPGYATRWKGLLFIGVSVIVISLDNTVLNTALPMISRVLGATTNELQWIVDAYILVFASLLLTTGSLGDRLGRKTTLQFGLVWFAVGSMAAAFVTNTTMLIVLRGTIAIGGALILPATLSIISATFPVKERAQAIAIWAGLFALGSGIGPVIGGFLLEHFSWNSVFLINLPTCAIALIGGALFLANSKDDNAPPVDVPGVVLSIIGFFLLTHGIIDAGEVGWSDQSVLISIGVAAIFLAAFVWWEAHSPNAMLPMRFFKNPSFSAASVTLSLVTFSWFGSLFFLSQYFQTVEGYSTLQAGLLVMPLALIVAMVATFSARVTARLGTKRTVAFGISIATVGLLFTAFTFKTDTPVILAIIAQVILGIGMGSTFSPATNSIMSAVPIDKAGVGSAMNDTTRQLGGALGVAVLGAVMNITYLGNVGTLKSALPQLTKPTLDLIGSSVQAAHEVAATLPAQAQRIVIATANQAFVDGMRSALIVAAVILAVMAVFVLLTLPAQVQRAEEVQSGMADFATRSDAESVPAGR